MEFQTLESTERRKRIIRIILFLIILSTTPFYCAGFLLWGTARPAGADSRATVATSTAIGGDLTPTRQPTLTPLPLTITVASPLQPTPLQFIPINPGTGGGGGVVPTQNVNQPPVFIPTSTLAPTLTPYPTNTQPPPPTQTPLPTDAPLPTNTPEPLPTDPPLPTEAPPPTDEQVPPPPADTGDTGSG